MAIYVEPVRADFWQLYREPGSNEYLDPLGPKNCQTHSAARSIMRANEGVRPAGITGVWPPTGAAIRKYTGDTVGGTNHRQMVAVAKNRYNTTLTEHYRLPFDDFVDLVEETRGGQLSVWYRRIRDTASRRGSYTFYQNHEFYLNGVDRDRGVFTGGVDPLADGRQTGLYHGPGEYSISLLRMAAGELNVSPDPNDYVKLGTGLCYALTTKATGAAPPTYKASVPAGSFFRYYLNTAKTAVLRRESLETAAFSGGCTARRLFPWPQASRSVRLVQMTSGPARGIWIGASYSNQPL